MFCIVFLIAFASGYTGSQYGSSMAKGKYFSPHEYCYPSLKDSAKRMLRAGPTAVFVLREKWHRVELPLHSIRTCQFKDVIQVYSLGKERSAF
jgi:hypothetical protein